MDDNLSITGRPVPRLTITANDRARLFVFLYPFARLPRAIADRDWILVGFCSIGIVGMLLVHRYGQPAASRTMAQKLLIFGMLATAVVLVIFAKAPLWRVAGLALAVLPFALDIALARQSQIGNQESGVGNHPS